MQEKIVKYFKTVWPFIVRYRLVFVLLVIATVTLLAINKIDQASNASRDENLYNKLQAEVNVIRFDEETIQDIRDLKESGASIGSDFPSNRRNPF